MFLAQKSEKKVKNDPKLVRDSNSSLKLRTFQLSNVRELETIKKAFAVIMLAVQILEAFVMLSLHIDGSTLVLL